MRPRIRPPSWPRFKSGDLIVSKLVNKQPRVPLTLFHVVGVDVADGLYTIAHGMTGSTITVSPSESWDPFCVKVGEL